MKNQVIIALEKALKKLNINEKIELTSAKGYADFATNIAMKLSSQLNDNPRNIAKKIIDQVDDKCISKIEIAGPGFINIFLNENIFVDVVRKIMSDKDKFGRGKQDKKINVEYVSANPTGHLHVGHARNAVTGSVLVNILRYAGNHVDAEYYINDVGNQINELGLSVYSRYLELHDQIIDIEKIGYKGLDIIETAQTLKNKFGDQFIHKTYEEVGQVFRDQSVSILLNIIKHHMAELGVEMDIYFSQASLSDELIQSAIDALRDHTFHNDGALWLNTTSKGDDKDRVLIKKDGIYTYLTPDIAYHRIKILRGYDELINVWGADHIGYVKRMKCAVEFLGLPHERLDILTIQLVKLLKDGQELKMSKRRGTSFTLKELLDEIGKDAMRWFLVDRTNASQFTLDINAAKENTQDNPVFVVQYSHARANQLILKSNVDVKPEHYDDREREIINEINKFPELVINIADTHKIHLLPQYLLSLARSFNSWYSNEKVIGHEHEGSKIALAQAVKYVLSNGLGIMGVSAPDVM